MVRMVRLFWSLDVQKTERWLADMSAKGLHIVGINLLTRQFRFEVGSPRVLTYRFGHQSPNLSLPQALVNGGWTSLFSQGKWYVVVNEAPSTELKTFPVRTGLIKRNNILLLICSGLIIYGAINLSTQALIFGWVFYRDVPIYLVESPFWILTPLLILTGLAFWGTVIYSSYALIKSNRSLGESIGEKGFSKVLKNKSNVLVKRKFIWWYSPDKLEQWLENMEAQGYNLQRVGSLATTYWFEKGSPRKVKYCIDYQRSLDEGYYDIHQENGWTLLYTRKYYPGKWSFWSQEHNQGSPQFYSEKTDVLSHARRVASTNLLMLIPFVLLFFLMVSEISFQLEHGLEPRAMVSNIIIGVLTLELGLFVALTVSYYLRVRRAISQEI